jgi:hypothetical protein
LPLKKNLKLLKNAAKPPNQLGLLSPLASVAKDLAGRQAAKMFELFSIYCTIL